jgi:hypothetical protein
MGVRKCALKFMNLMAYAGGLFFGEQKAIMTRE